MTTPRSIVHRYQDPLDLVWLATAEKLGIKIRRSSEVYAAWDGDGTLTLGATEDLDPDDCLAQMILHELCHALVEGDHAQTQRDWGLENVDDRDAVSEFAAMRLQAALLDPHGLRQVLAVTTDWRDDYDALPRDPLLGDEDATQRARIGWQRALHGPWAEPLADALKASASIARAVAPFASGHALWTLTDSPSASSDS